MSFLVVVTFVVFLVLKLVGVLDWSWWLVTAPLWVGFSVWLLIVTVYVTLARWMSKSYKNWRS